MRTLFIIIVVLLLSAEAEAVTRYVKTTCTNGATTYNPATDSCTGGSSTVYNTIQNGVNATIAGDILYIRGANYGNVTVATANNGTALCTYAKPVAACATAPVIAAYPGETVTIRLLNVSHNYNIIDRLIVDGVLAATGNVINVGSGSHHVRFSNIEAKNARHVGGGAPVGQDTGCGFFLGPSGGGFHEILDSNIHDNGNSDNAGSNDHGIYLEQSNVIMDHTIFTNNSGYGVHMYNNGAGGVNNNTVRYSTFTQNGQRGTNLNTAAILVSDATGTIIHNNLMYNNEGGIQFGSPASDQTRVFNNTIYGSVNWGLDIENPNQTNIQVRNNIFINNPTTFQNFGTAPTFSNNLCSDANTTVCPGATTLRSQTAANTFTNASATPPDFSLKAGSNAIDTGTDLSVQIGSSDITGAPRPANQWDIGAYEFSAAPTGATIQTVTWSNTRTGASGSAASFTPAASINWNITGVALLPGINPITVTGTDSNSVQGSANITVTYAPLFPGNALVGAWAFDETATVGSCTFPGCALDSSGATPSNNATLIGTATRTSNSIFPPGLLLNGLNGYVIVPYSNSINFTQSFTYAAWVNMAVQHSDYRSVFEREAYGQNLSAIWASVQSWCGNGAVAVNVRVDGENGTDYSICDPRPLTIGTWTFLALTYDGVSGGGLKFYRSDYGLANVQTVPGASGYMGPPTISAANNSLGIGAHPSGVQIFDGRIDEARIANYALPYTCVPGTATCTTGKGTNVTPGAACDYSDVDTNGKLNLSVVSAMNCRIISPAPPLLVKFPAAASGLQVQPGTTFKLGQP